MNNEKSGQASGGAGSTDLQRMENEQITPMLSVIIPVYNEEITIGIILEKVHCLKFVREIIVVEMVRQTPPLATWKN